MGGDEANFSFCSVRRNAAANVAFFPQKMRALPYCYSLQTWKATEWVKVHTDFNFGVPKYKSNMAQIVSSSYDKRYPLRLLIPIFDKMYLYIKLDFFLNIALFNRDDNSIPLLCTCMWRTGSGNHGKNMARGVGRISGFWSPRAHSLIMRGSVSVNEILTAYYCIRKPKPTVMPTTFTRKNVVTIWGLSHRAGRAAHQSQVGIECTYYAGRRPRPRAL
jgi:hypothetical protein